MKKHGSAFAHWLILAVLGVVIILGRQLAKNIVYTIIGAGLILVAAAGVADWWKEKSTKPEALSRLIGSVVFCAIGLWILLNPGAFDTLLNVVIGLVLIVAGLIWFARGWKLGKDGLILTLSAIAVILGLIIACNNAATTWVVIAEGIGLIYVGVSGMITEKRFGR